MTSIDSSPPINPPVRRIAVVIHSFGGPAARPGPADRAEEDGAAVRAVARARPGRHHATDGSWLGLAERVLRPWPVTLRLAVLLLVLATGTATVAAAIGVAGQLLLVAVGFGVHRRHRRRLGDLQARLAATRRADGPRKRRTAGR